MDKRMAIVILFSLAVAVAASYVVYAMLIRHMGPQSTKGTIAIVAARDLPLGTVIHEADLNVTEIASVVPGNLGSKEDILGRGVASNMYKGEPILEGRLSPKGAGGGLTGLIRHGMRAAAVRVNEVVGVSGFVRPGMHVDVITSGTPPDASQRNVGTVSRIILQNLEVLSAGQDLDRDAEGKPVSVQVVNLLVAPEQAETLALASSEAKVQLILRNPMDTEIARTPGTNTAALFNPEGIHATTAPVVYKSIHLVPKPVKELAVVPAPHAVTVEVVNGGKRETVTLGYTASQTKGVAQ